MGLEKITFGSKVMPSFRTGESDVRESDEEWEYEMVWDFLDLT